MTEATIIACGCPRERCAARVFKGKPRSEARLKLAQMMLEDQEVADAYQELFDDLRLAPPLGADNSILLTSAPPDEGKTTVSLCLAITASYARQSVLLMDGDQRRSSLTAALGGDGNAGLIEVLLGQAEAPEAIRPAAIEGPKTAGVSFMPAGRKPPASLGALDWSKTRPAFKCISQEFGFVFLDSPPVLAANDALLFAGTVDAVLLVVGAASANLDEIKRAKQLLESIGAPIIGAVPNRFEPKGSWPFEPALRRLLPAVAHVSDASSAPSNCPPTVRDVGLPSLCGERAEPTWPTSPRSWIRLTRRVVRRY